MQPRDGLPKTETTFSPSPQEFPMSENERLTVLLSLIRHLRSNGCVCSETYFQKAGIFLQELLGVPLELNVYLLQYSVYAGDLDDAINAMRAYNVLKYKLDEAPAWETL